MTAIKDLCTKLSSLTSEQIELIAGRSKVFSLASDIAHAQLTVYVKAKTEKLLVIVDQVRPNTSFIQNKPCAIGTAVFANEEPIVWRTIETGQIITGQREWALGMWMQMQTFPFFDNNGNVIAVLSFETNLEESKTEGYSILPETAYLLLTTDKIPPDFKHCRPIAASDGILVINERGRVIYSNHTADSIYKMLGVGQTIGVGINDRKLNLRIVHKAVKARAPVETELSVGNITLIQRIIPIIKDDEAIRTVAIIADVTEIKKKEKELLIKSAVIQEIHHRVKNNLQTIASLLRLQARRTESVQVKAALRESVNRILSISVVHEFLSQQDAEYIDVVEVARNILDLVIQNMLEPEFNLQTVFNGQTIILPSEQASSLALVINELIQNSIEHGFVGRVEGTIGINITKNPSAYKVEIYDDGIGLPADFDVKSSKSLGLQIVRTLVENDLGGRFELYSERGTRACITIPNASEGGK